MDTFITVDMCIFIVMAFLWTPLIKNQILRYVVYKPHLLLLLLLDMGKLSNYSIKFYNYIAKINVFELLLFSHYLSLLKPLFGSLDILKFESLVIPRNYLQMYKIVLTSTT